MNRYKCNQCEVVFTDEDIKHSICPWCDELLAKWRIGEADDCGFVVSLFGRFAQGALPSGIELMPDRRNFTRHVIQAVQRFVQGESPQVTSISPEDKTEILEAACNYMTDTSDFDLDEFGAAVAPDDAMAWALRNYINDRGPGGGDIDHFAISKPTAVKVTGAARRVIKLDKRFSVYVHGGASFMERSFDEERQLNFYKLYFEEEE